MPLAFESLSHGIIAFGFFNIKTDMILMENYFFFAEDFCNKIVELAEKESYYVTDEFPTFEIKDPIKIGNLMKAINGIEFEGFIGELYKLFPFPKELKEFKQDPYGFENREIVSRIIQRYGEKKIIAIELSQESETLRFGRYLFSKKQFSKLLDYIWEGGYPKWRDNNRPGYVLRMCQACSMAKMSILKWKP